LNDIINQQSSNELFAIAILAVLSWMIENGAQVISAGATVIGLIFVIKRYYEDKKKRDIDIEFTLLKIKELKDSAE